MATRTYMTAWKRWLAIPAALALVVPVRLCQAQAGGPILEPAAPAAGLPPKSQAVPAASASAGVNGARFSLDRVVAIVNGDLVLESDVDEDRRFMAFQPLRDLGTKFSRDEAVNRIVDRTLILQQDALQPQAAIADSEVDEQLAALRKNIPECKAFHCESDTGWARFVDAQGFTLEELHERWKQRMEVLRYIEERFRMGIRISQADIDAYYTNTLLPAYAKQKVPAPKQDTITDRIQEILLQQQVSKLMDDWLKALRAQGTVRIMKPGEALP